MSQSTSSTPGERFSQYFQVAPALDEASRNEVYFIRHDVYARELGFEPVRADQRERDHYDDHAVHCIVRASSADRRPVGCARVVMTDAADRDAPLPFEVACRDSLDRSIVDPARLPRDRIGEVSRLAVMGEFRRRRGELGPVNLSSADTGGQPTPRFPNIPLSLYFAAVAMAQRQGLEYLFTLTEPRLSKHFAMLGVKIQTIGGAVEHRGLRVPSMMRVSEIYPRLRSLVRPLWHEVHGQMDTGYVLHAAMQHANEADPVMESGFGAISS